MKIDNSRIKSAKSAKKFYRKQYRIWKSVFYKRTLSETENIENFIKKISK